MGCRAPIDKIFPTGRVPVPFLVQPVPRPILSVDWLLIQRTWHHVRLWFFQNIFRRIFLWFCISSFYAWTIWFVYSVKTYVSFFQRWVPGILQRILLISGFPLNAKKSARFFSFQDYAPENWKNTSNRARVFSCLVVMFVSTSSIGQEICVPASGR